jgi:N-acyl-D-amino-acid deacylase
MKTLALVLVAVAMGAATAHAQIPDFTPQTPLIAALLHNDSAEAARLIARGADPNDGQFFGLSPLLLAVLRQDLPVVRLLASHGADLNARDRSGSTALMWAAFDEAGDATIADELLARGADPFATNRSGESALTWALRRGETRAVAALRKAGASDDAAIKTSIERAIALLQKSGAQFTHVSGCYSCHHQSLPAMAFGLARARGVEVDEAAARQQADRTVAVMKTVYAKAVDNRDRIPDAPISVGYALIGLAAQRYERNEITDAMTRVIAAWQSDDGAFYPLPAMRPPIEASAFTATALSIRAMQLYGAPTEEQIARARNWLRTATPHTTEDRVMQVLGLVWTNAAGEDVGRSSEQLAAEQRPDGGWAQIPTLETDAYATGQALVALEASGRSTSSAEYRRGVSFLMRTQFADGSWLVRSRTFPVQPLRDTGFPHGKDQWISAAGTSWAAMALSLALPAETTCARASGGCD